MEEIKQVWPHDLLTFNDNHDLILKGNPLPDWAKVSLSKAKIVVVRRGLAKQGLIPVGLRGSRRSQRLAGFLVKKRVINCYSPAYFIKNKSWEILTPERRKLPQFQALEKICPLLRKYSWGIGGSLAYEMATGIAMVQNNLNHRSDLDIILVAKRKINIEQSRKLLTVLNQYQVHADVQVVKGQNGFALAEYAANRSPKVLVKTTAGPVLTADPWHFLKVN